MCVVGISIAMTSMLITWWTMLSKRKLAWSYCCLFVVWTSSWMLCCCVFNVWICLDVDWMCMKMPSHAAKTLLLFWTWPRNPYDSYSVCLYYVATWVLRPCCRVICLFRLLFDDYDHEVMMLLLLFKTWCSVQKNSHDYVVLLLMFIAICWICFCSCLWMMLFENECWLFTNAMLLLKPY